MRALCLLALFACLFPNPAWSKEAEGSWLPLGSLEQWNSAVLDLLPERFLILGEMHGSAEAPRAALGLALSLRSQGRTPVLAVEWPERLQGQVDAHNWDELKTDGLFRAADGRTSLAMVETLQRAQAAGIPIRCFDQTAANADEREVQTALALLKVGEERPKSTIVVLVGNYHSRQRDVSLPLPPQFSMAMNLVEAGASVCSIKVTSETGEAWNIVGNDRGPHPAGEPLNSVSPPAFRRSVEGLDQGHQARLHLAQSSASPPWAEQLSPLAQETTTSDNEELALLFERDQSARQGDTSKIDWAKVAPEDAARRARVAQMLEEGTVKTGRDFWHAAFIFQHGSKPDDFLLAHALACAAVAKGYPGANWIAAATLDRYLGNIGQPQIYGTQYKKAKEGEWNQGDYNKSLISDALRQAVGVPTLSEQEATLEEMRARDRLAPTR